MTIASHAEFSDHGGIEYQKGAVSMVAIGTWVATWTRSRQGPTHAIAKICAAVAMSAAACTALTFSAGAYAADMSGKTIQVGMNPIYPPMEYRDPANNALIGFDIDLGNALAAQLHAKLEWQTTSFAQLLPSLKTQRVDMILSGMSDKEERRASVDFVDYLNSGAQAFTLASRAKEFPDLMSLCGKKVGMSRSTSFNPETVKWSDEHCVKAGKPPIEVVGTEDSTAARIELKQQRVDAMVQGTETIAYAMQLEPGVYAPVGTKYAPVFQGMAFRKDDTVLRDTVAAALKTLMANGTYAKLIDKWHLQTSAAPAVTINGQ